MTDFRDRLFTMEGGGGRGEIERSGISLKGNEGPSKLSLHAFAIF